jgi:hypothetical protein
MTEYYYPFDAGAGSSIYEGQWSKLIRSAAICNGYVPLYLNELLVYGDSTGMQVKVKTGAIWIMGHYYETDAELTKAIAASDPTNPRYDRVVARLDWSNNLVSIAVVTGTPAGSPSIPALTQSSTVWEICLAVVRVNATVSTIAADKVYDFRMSCFGSYEIEYPIGSGLATVSTGVLTTGIKIPWPGRIDHWSLSADAAGSIQVDIWKDLFGVYPPTVADTIVSSGKPILSTARVASSAVATASGTPAGSYWTGAVLAGSHDPNRLSGDIQYLLLYVDSATTVKQALLTLRVQKHPIWVGW